MLLTDSVDDCGGIAPHTEFYGDDCPPPPPFASAAYGEFAMGISIGRSEQFKG